jgi:hypothetical protein
MKCSGRRRDRSGRISTSVPCVDKEPILIARMQSREGVACGGLGQNGRGNAICSRKMVIEVA